MFKNRVIISLVTFLAAVGCARQSGETASLRIVRTDGTVQEKIINFTFRKGCLEFVFPKASIEGVDTLYIIPEMTKAAAGTDGYYVNSEGIVTRMLEGREGRYSLRHRHPMPIAGCVKGGRAWMEFFPNYRFDSHISIICKDGEYKQVFAFTPFDHKAYDGDYVLRFYPLEGKEATYAGIGRLYRSIRLSQGGLKPLREKVKNRPLLRYAVDYPEIRIRQGWKPVPCQVEHQTLENEPPMRVAVTFDKVCEIIDSLKAQGVPGAQLTLVGWNIRGHDGRFPTIFPPEPALGGEEGLKHLIAYAREKGFQIVPHICTGDSYEISEDFDINDVALLPNGKRYSQFSYGGGRMFELCYEQAYKKYAVPYCDSLAKLGFRGVAYNDVYSIVAPHACTDPNHYNNPSQAAEWARKTLRVMKDKLGGVASEGGYDHLSGDLDFALYISMLGPRTIRFEKLRDAQVPLWQIVYNGYIYSCPFSRSVNYTIKEPEWAMKMQEYGGHPTFYFYSAHRDDDKNWIGTPTCDLLASDGRDIHNSAVAIRKGWDYMKEYGYLQYETMEDHCELAPGVFKTTYGDGSVIICNYGDDPYICPDGSIVGSKDWKIFKGPKRGGETAGFSDSANSKVRLSMKDTMLSALSDTMWVNLDRGERVVLSGPVLPAPKGRFRMNGWQVFKDDDNRFLFGRERFKDGEYMVAWRICGGVKVLQEAAKLPKGYSKKPVYGRITLRHDRNVRFYYAFEQLSHFDASGWDSFSGVMDASIVKHSGREGRKGAWLASFSGKGPEGEPFKNVLKPFKPSLVATIPPRESSDYSCQGLAIHGDTAIIIRDKGWCEIYDLKAGHDISFYKLEGNDSHCNNAVFGVEHGSVFPLLYISEDGGGHACLVTDIGLESSRIVQRIYYDTDGRDYPGPFDWMVDRENGFLYTYGGSRWKDRWVKRFPLPGAGVPVVHLKPEDALWTMYYDEVGIGQGGFVKDGRIYLTAGYPPYYCKLHVYDEKSGRQLLCQDLRELRFEPEGIDWRDDALYLVFWGGKKEGARVYSMSQE
ncbi:MAG: hypothetical protein IJ686_00175 [Bacteroidales bacterium]|nr:hypothetical protein [Bacteroidales bacterium]